MTSRDFCYWLQGLFELGDVKMLSPAQTDLIKRHLAMVFLHDIDPSAGGGPAQQETLNKIHEGIKEAAKTQLPHPRCSLAEAGGEQEGRRHEHAG